MGPPARLALLSTEQQAGQGELADLHREAADEQELGSEEGDDEDEDEQEDEPTIKNEGKHTQQFVKASLCLGFCFIARPAKRSVSS